MLHTKTSNTVYDKNHLEVLPTTYHQPEAYSLIKHLNVRFFFCGIMKVQA